MIKFLLFILLAGVVITENIENESRGTTSVTLLNNKYSSSGTAFLSEVRGKLYLVSNAHICHKIVVKRSVDNSRKSIYAFSKDASSNKFTVMFNKKQRIFINIGKEVKMTVNEDSDLCAISIPSNRAVSFNG